MCGICDIQNIQTEPLNLFTDDDYERIINAIYLKMVDTHRLDYPTYKKIADQLTKGVFEGFGKDFNHVMSGTPDYIMLRSLRENVYIFSGAKTYQQTRAVTRLLTTEDAITSFSDFKKQAKAILKEYNETYLLTEYNSSIAQANSARQWMQFEEDAALLPMLTYQTAGDQRVRPSHAALDNISRPVNDKFWNSYMPPNGWNCRCTVIQTDDATKTNLQGFKQPSDVPDIFMFNSGKDKIIFSPLHPYFDVAAKDKTLLKRNFDLPLP